MNPPPKECQADRIDGTFSMDGMGRKVYEKIDTTATTTTTTDQPATVTNPNPAAVMVIAAVPLDAILTDPGFEQIEYVGGITKTIKT